nr:hypothetical protein CFP56_75840 [Quercus suber]
MLCHPIAGGTEEDAILEPISTAVWGPKAGSLMTSKAVESRGRRSLWLQGRSSAGQELVSCHCPSNHHLEIKVLGFGSFERRVYEFNHYLPFKSSFFVWPFNEDVLGPNVEHRVHCTVP